MKSNIFNILYLASYERSILKRYPSVCKAWNQYKWQDCIDYTNDIIKEFSPIIQDSYQYILFRVMMYCHFMLRNFDVSYDFALRVLDHTLEMKDSIQVSRALMDIGRIHKVVEDIPIAITFFKEAIKLDPSNIIAVSELSMSYLEIKQFELAECSIRRIDELEGAENNTLPPLAVKLIKIYFYIQKENYNKSKDILKNIEPEFMNPEYSLSSPLFYFLNGLVYYHTEEYTSALDLLTKSLDLCNDYDRKNIQLNALKFRSLTYQKLGDFKNAYFDKKELNFLVNKNNNLIFNQRLSILKKYYFRKKNELKNQQIIEKAIRLTSVSLMADNMIYEITPHLHSIHVNVDSILFWDKRHPGLLPSLFIEEIKMIKESILRTEQIITQMKCFWSPSKDELIKESIDVNESIMTARNIVQKNHDLSGIDIKFHLSAKHLFVKANPILMEQIFINLISNAVQALKRSEKKGNLIVISSSVASNNVLVKIDDNAGGFNLDFSNSAFDPLHHVKYQANGMGLGLMIVKNFLDRFSGTISIDNNEIGGATFLVRLPMA